MLVITALLLVIALTACDTVTNTVRIEGSGNGVTEQRPVSEFTAIHVAGQGVINITQGDAHALEVTADDNLQELLTSTVTSGTLTLGIKPNTTINAITPIVYEISVPALREIRVSGSANVNFDSFEGDSLVINVSGSGTVNAADLRVTDFGIEVGGTGGAVISGSADSLRVVFSGSGSFNGEDFPVADAVVEVSGSANATVNAAETLNVNIGGSGVVTYIGDPQVTQRISGSGSVRAR
jgi:hypothetical protein